MAGAAFDVVWFVIATETSEQWAALWTAIPHFHVIIGTAVMSFSLQSKQAQWIVERIVEQTDGKEGSRKKIRVNKYKKSASYLTEFRNGWYTGLKILYFCHTNFWPQNILTQKWIKHNEMTYKYTCFP